MFASTQIHPPYCYLCKILVSAHGRTSGRRGYISTATHLGTSSWLGIEGKPYLSVRREVSSTVLARYIRNMMRAALPESSTSTSKESCSSTCRSLKRRRAFGHLSKGLGVVSAVAGCCTLLVATTQQMSGEQMGDTPVPSIW